MSLAFLLVLGLVGLGLMLNGRRRAARDAAEPDAAILAALTRAGSDLRQPHELEFFLYFPTETAAASVASSLQADGFVTRVSRDETGGEWLCLATRQMRPSLSELGLLRTRLSALASAAGGAYDGWGATVVAPQEQGTARPDPDT
jgi:hypothetical protein